MQSGHNLVFQTVRAMWSTTEKHRLSVIWLFLGCLLDGPCLGVCPSLPQVQDYQGRVLSPAGTLPWGSVSRQVGQHNLEIPWFSAKRQFTCMYHSIKTLLINHSHMPQRVISRASVATGETMLCDMKIVIRTLQIWKARQSIKTGFYTDCTHLLWFLELTHLWWICV